MAVEAAIETDVKSGEFQSLEDKVYRAIEMLKAAREAKAAAERESDKLRDKLASREEELDTLRSEVVGLKKEREEVRGRVEKLLGQIDKLVAEEEIA